MVIFFSLFSFFIFIFFVSRIHDGGPQRVKPKQESGIEKKQVSNLLLELLHGGWHGLVLHETPQEKIIRVHVRTGWRSEESPSC